jgi:hypothetical protein
LAGELWSSPSGSLSACSTAQLQRMQKLDLKGFDNYWIKRYIRRFAPKYGHHVRSRELTTNFPTPIRNHDTSRAVFIVIEEEDWEELEHDPAWHRDKRGDLLQQVMGRLPNLVDVSIIYVLDYDTGVVPDLGKTLASMRHIKTLHLQRIQIDRSWAIPFVSGGLSDLTIDQCDTLGMAGLDAMLTVYANTLRRLRLSCEPRGRGFAQAAGYSLNRLESLSIENIEASEEYLRRFSGSPLETLEVIYPPPFCQSNRARR